MGMMINAKCERCGYEFDPQNPGISVYEFLTENGVYRACSRCIAKLGAINSEVDRKAYMEEFRVKGDDEVELI